MRGETTTLFVPLAHMMARGLYVMVPPQAKPAQPMVMGATTWRTVSNSALAGMTAGMATR